MDSNGLGWFFSILEEDIGPAGTVHQEYWKAVVYHPDGHIKYFYDYGYKLIWMERLD